MLSNSLHWKSEKNLIIVEIKIRNFFYLSLDYLRAFEYPLHECECKCHPPPIMGKTVNSKYSSSSIYRSQYTLLHQFLHTSYTLHFLHDRTLRFLCATLRFSPVTIRSWHTTFLTRFLHAFLVQ